MKSVRTSRVIRGVSVTVVNLLLALKVSGAGDDFTISELSMSPRLAPMAGGSFSMEGPIMGYRAASLAGGEYTMETTVTPLPPLLVMGDAEVFITLNGGQAVVTWSAPGTGYVLESTTAIGAMASWRPVSPAPTEARFAVQPTAGAPQFFRLRRD